MPIIYKNIEDQDLDVRVWRISESLDTLTQQISLTQKELNGVERLNKNRKKQWFACRHCLATMLLPQEQKIVCLKDEYGKPFLTNSSLEISMSHSGEMAAVSTSLFKNGVDIQKLTTKIDRVKQKFLDAEELEHLSKDDELTSLHIYWGAKESIYKAHGKKKLSFARDIRIQRFDPKLTSGHTVGFLTTSATISTFQINWIWIEDYVLVYARLLV